MNRSITALLVLSAASHAATSAADSVPGAQVLQAQHSIECHALNGLAPGSGRILALSRTVVLRPSTLWNHAPAMSSAMTEHNNPVSANG
jgi:hypothetical protein